MIYYGYISGGSSFSVSAWWLYDGGTCNDPTVNSCNGTFLDGKGFNWGNIVSGSYTATKPAGTYTYWFCMGNRLGGHGWYDVCVSSDVVVEDECSLSTDEINSYIQDLDDGSFKNNPDNRKNAFENKLDAVQGQIDAGDYQAAIDKLTV